MAIEDTVHIIQEWRTKPDVLSLTSGFRCQAIPGGWVKKRSSRLPSREKLAYTNHGIYRKISSPDWIVVESASDSWASIVRQAELRMLRARAEQLREEFTELAKKWRRETRHVSLVAKKITHPAYLRIIGMGRPAIPLLLEALRDQPAHWFVALKSTTNVEPLEPTANPQQARDAWLAWGKTQGYID